MIVAIAKPLALGTLLLVSGPPMPDRSVDKMCASSSNDAGDQTATASCKRDERTARESLMKEWDTVPSSARQTCINSIDNVAPSFVVLKSCIDDSVELSKSHQDAK